MKLNVGCGNRLIQGYRGVDVVRRDAVDIVAPAHDIPLPDASVDEILSVHSWEHFYLWETDAVLTEWRRLLKPGGKLAMEMPDLLKCCRAVLESLTAGKHPDQLGLFGLYGDPRHNDPHMVHRWGWTPATLRAKLTEAGFTDIREERTQWHPVGRDLRDMRMVATR